MELLRSWMFVPGHRQRMIDKALSLDADAIMLDIEDGVAPNEKDAARKNIADSLGRDKASGTPARYVRINAIGHARMDADLDAVVRRVEQSLGALDGNEEFDSADGHPQFGFAIGQDRVDFARFGHSVHFR